MSLDTEHVGIPDQPYDALLGMSSSEFSKIIRDLSSLSETVSIYINEDSVKFNANGDIGSGSIALKPTESVDKVTKSQTSFICFKFAWLLSFYRRILL